MLKQAKLDKINFSQVSTCIFKNLSNYSHITQDYLIKSAV